MSINEIQSRIVDELKLVPPFSLLDNYTLQALAKKCVVSYHHDEEIIFKKGDSPDQYCWLVKDGRIELSLNPDDPSVLSDVCEPGDMFGLRSLLTGEPFSLTAYVSGEALLYAFPVSELKYLMEKHSEIAIYIANVLANRLKEHELKVVWEESPYLSENNLGSAFIENHRDLIWCKPDEAVRSCAEKMVKYKVSSVVVLDENTHPVGIITEADIARKIGTGLYSIEATAEQIMSSPAVCIGPDYTSEMASLTLLEHSFKHLVVTKDGSTSSKCLGVITSNDLQVKQVESPHRILKSIQHSENLSQLKLRAEEIQRLIKQQIQSGIPADYLGRIVGTLNDNLMSKSLKLIRRTTPIEPEIDWCFVSLGSMARYEQIWPTDQDNALIYRINGDTISAKCKESMLRFGRKVNAWLEELGFENCPANIMAGNPEWCKTDEEWKSTFEKWIRTPSPKNVMHTTIFFDMRAIYGSIQLVNDLKTHWKHLLEKHRDFLSYLGADALKSPAPIGFFRHFLVEKNGSHKDQFDLKTRSIMPIVDAARLFALSLGLTYEVSTTDRLDAIMQHVENDADKVDLFNALKKAYGHILSFRAKASLQNQDSGRFININELDRYDRQILKQCFRPVSELSALIEQKFDTALVNR